MTRSRDIADQQKNLGGAVAPFVAGKNKIINGDFGVNQRAFSSTTTTGSYGFDRWYYTGSGSGTLTYSAQTFTLGTAPVAGYEGTNFARVVTASQSAASDYCWLSQKIESVRTYAGQTVTVSFWAKTATGTPKIAVELEQNVGTGGTPSGGAFNFAGQITLSTTWTRYSVSTTLANLSGYVLGTNNNNYLALNLWISAGTTYNSRTGSLGVQNATFDIWGVQVEAGSVATPFTTASGTIQGELALCQRYYWRTNADSTFTPYAIGAYTGTTSASVQARNPVQMRTAPSSIDYSTLGAFDFNSTLTATAVTIASGGRDASSLNVTVASGGTLYRPVSLCANNSTNGYLGFSAEL